MLFIKLIGSILCTNDYDYKILIGPSDATMAFMSTAATVAFKNLRTTNSDASVSK